MQPITTLIEYFNGTFAAEPTVIKQKLRNIKAFIFDWDGVFNNGEKNIEGHSSFSEVDSMGVNLMRFNHFLLQKNLPVCAIITGEDNKLAFSFAKRENFNAVYYGFKNKEAALLHFCKQNNISPSEVMFVFDDVLDFSVAKIVGLRIMVSRSSSALLSVYAQENRLADYLTFHNGGNHALRETSELVTMLTNNFNRVIELRMKNAEDYQRYINTRKEVRPSMFTTDGEQITQQ